MSKNRTISTISTVAVMVMALVIPRLVSAATCNVPSPSHPDIQTAVDVIGCDPIVVGAGSFAETVVIDRSLTLTGAGSGQSFIQGGVEVRSGSVLMTGFHISGPGEAMWSHSGAELSGLDLQVVNGVVEPPLFADGFESGDTSGWSGTAP